MSDFRIASRYAKALFDKAVEMGELDAVKKDIEHLKSLSTNSHEFTVFLQSPLYKMSVKQQALNKMFSGANALTLGVFRLMTEKYRESIIPAMGDAFLTMYNNHNKIVDTIVTSAVALDKKTLEDIEAFVKTNTNANQINISQKINASLVGGLTIEFGGKIYDNTISTQLRKIKKELQLA